MNFFESQAAARRRTRDLVVLFALAVVAIILSVWLAVGVASAMAADESDLPWNPWSLESLGSVAAVVLVIVLTGSLYKTATLRSGGPAVARLLGARPANPGTSDLRERRLMNVVEEMAIASGMAVPSVYVLDGEKGINAFAAGFSPTDTVVAVTRGTLDYLDRDELQGVIGHELSHALNGDTRIKLKLMGVLHGILVIAIIGRILLRVTSDGGRSRSRKNDPRGALVVLGLALLAIGYIGVIFGRLIKAAVSRQRELLADAAAVQFTRNPSGIAGALKKIGALAAGSKVEHARAEEASHLFFGPVVSALGSLLATHPPLPERIRRLDPQWSGELPRLDEEATRAAVASTLEEPARARGFAGPGGFVQGAAAVLAASQASTTAVPAPAPAAPPPLPSVPPPAPEPRPPAAAQPAVALDPKAVTASVGRVEPAHIAYAERLIAALPGALRSDIQEPLGATAVALALLIDRDPALRRRQLDELRASVEPIQYAESVRVIPLVDACPVEARLPLLDLALPALRRLSEPQYRRLAAAVGRLMAADARLSLFEFTMQRVLLRHLESHFRRQPPPPAVHGSVAAVAAPAGILLSALAHAGQRPDAAAAAFAAAKAALGGDGGVTLCPPQQCGVDAIDRALAALVQATPPVKQRLLEACVTAVAYDRRVTVKEGELLRAVADSLDCPLPPFVAGQTL